MLRPQRPFRLPGRFPGHEFWWYGFMHVVFTIAIIALLVMLAVWLANSMRRNQHVQAAGQAPMIPIPPPPVAPMPTPATDPALYEARMRYARGEISREDYVRITRDLGGSAPPDEPAPTIGP